jgi:hypothetical protein
MTLSDAMQPPGLLASGRFFRTGYLPTYAATVFLLVLIWAGAPGRPVDFSQAWRTGKDLSVVAALLLALAVALVAVLLQPLQMSMVRALEGGFPQWLGAGLASHLQIQRKNRLAKKVADRVRDAAALPDDAACRQQRNMLIQQAGSASAILRARFPGPEHLVRATALGNALAAMEHTGGAAYGLDTVVVWPRLYPVLGDQVRAIVDDLRDGLDAAVRLAATGTLTAIATVGLLAWHSGWFTLLALIPLATAVLGYIGGVRAAMAYGAAVQVAFDVHRFDLLRALHLALPKDQLVERENNRALSDFLRQGVPVPFTYAEPKSPLESPL